LIQKHPEAQEALRNGLISLYENIDAGHVERLAGAAIPELAVTLLTAGVSAAGNAARRSGAAANLLESMQDFGSMASRIVGNEHGSTPIFGDIANKVLGRVDDVASKATDLPIVKPGTQQWTETVDSLSGLGKGKLNVRTETATDAKALFNEARGNMNRYKNYTNQSYKKGYETHNVQNSRELGAGNDLQHLKWKDGKSGGHIYYEKAN
jgi:hypothetical protein